MKILHVNSLYHPHAVGGAEKSVQALAQAQLAAGHSVTVLTLTPEESHAGEVNGVKVYYAGLRNLYWPFQNEPASLVRKSVWHALDSYNPFMSEGIDAVLKAERPDLIHTHNLTGFSAAAWRAAARRSLPVVHTLRDYSLLCPKVTMFSKGENCRRQHLTCRALSVPRMVLSRHLGAVTAISQFILDRHLAAGAFTTVSIREVIHNFQSPVIFRNSSPSKAGKAFTFGFIGQLAPAKGLELLLKAFSKLVDPRCELIIAGTGDPACERRLRELARGNNVRFLGMTRPEEFYPAIDVLVVPSLWNEPFGRVIVEAYSYGVPVLASERGGIPEIVDHLSTGILFNPDVPDALFKELECLSTDQQLMEKLAANAADKAKEFLPKAICEQYDAVYSQVTG